MQMGRSVSFIATALCCTFSAHWCGSAVAQSDHKESGVRSERVSLGRGDFWVIATDDNTLRLVHELDNKLVEQKIIPSPIPAGTIRDIALARFGNRGGGLVAVVKVRLADTVEFWSLTLSGLDHETAEDAISAPAARLMSGHATDQILALSGTRKGTIFTVVVGTMSEKRPGTIDTGTILIDGCPFPTPSNGRIGQFRPTYAPEAFDQPDNALIPK
jgi:hypothetical protein